MSRKVQNVTVIGPTVQLAFPALQLQNVPAKIDTGADGSSIWASGIKEDNGVLTYVLFGTSSTFYTGTEIRTRNYSVVKVKNSFGQIERRYRVKLMMNLGGRMIRARFNLADRSGQDFPVLIGRRTLRGKFIVDVSKLAEDKKYRVLVLVSHLHGTVKKLIAESEKSHKNLRFTVAAYDNLRFELDNKKSRIIIGDSGKDVAGYDMVYFKTVGSQLDVAAAVARYLKNRNIQFFDLAVSRHASADKLNQYILLSDNGVRIPKSIYMDKPTLKKSFEYLKKELGMPFILKDVYGNKGKDNFLVNTKREFTAVYAQTNGSPVNLIAQQYIPNEGDYRLLVFGGVIGVVINRKAPDSTHRNNTSVGGLATLAGKNKLPGKVKDDALRAAKLLNREIAGVDMVQDKLTGTWYCLEVNEGPQIASGAFVAEKRQAFTNYIHKRLEKLT